MAELNREADLHERMMDLEVKLAFSDKLIRDLDEVLQELMARLAKAEQEISALKRDKAQLSTSGSEKPPHY